MVAIKDRIKAGQVPAFAERRKKIERLRGTPEFDVEMGKYRDDAAKYIESMASGVRQGKEQIFLDALKSGMSPERAKAKVKGDVLYDIEREKGKLEQEQEGHSSVKDKLMTMLGGAANTASLGLDSKVVPALGDLLGNENMRQYNALRSDMSEQNPGWDAGGRVATILGSLAGGAGTSGASKIVPGLKDPVGMAGNAGLGALLGGVSGGLNTNPLDSSDVEGNFVKGQERTGAEIASNAGGGAALGGLLGALGSQVPRLWGGGQPMFKPSTPNQGGEAGGLISSLISRASGGGKTAMQVGSDLGVIPRPLARLAQTLFKDKAPEAPPPIEMPSWLETNVVPPSNPAPVMPPKPKPSSDWSIESTDPGAYGRLKQGVPGKIKNAAGDEVTTPPEMSEAPPDTPEMSMRQEEIPVTDSDIAPEHSDEFLEWLAQEDSQTPSWMTRNMIPESQPPSNPQPRTTTASEKPVSEDALEWLAQEDSQTPSWMTRNMIPETPIGSPTLYPRAPSVPKAQKQTSNEALDWLAGRPPPRAKTRTEQLEEQIEQIKGGGSYKEEAIPSAQAQPKAKEFPFDMDRLADTVMSMPVKERAALITMLRKTYGDQVAIDIAKTLKLKRVKNTGNVP